MYGEPVECVRTLDVLGRISWTLRIWSTSPNVSRFSPFQNFTGEFAIILMAHGWACSAGQKRSHYARAPAVRSSLDCRRRAKSMWRGTKQHETWIDDSLAQWKSSGSSRISSRFAPCACFEKVTHDFEFTRLRTITEADSTHPSVKALNTSQSPFEVIVQAKGKVEDARTFMFPKHLAVGVMFTVSPGNDAEVSSVMTTLSSTASPRAGYLLT